MSLLAIGQEEKDRLQYEMQLFGNRGKKWKACFADRNYYEIHESGPVKAESIDDYILRPEDVRHL
jgi:hypothetical protein